MNIEDCLNLIKLNFDEQMEWISKKNPNHIITDAEYDAIDYLVFKCGYSYIETDEQSGQLP